MAKSINQDIRAGKSVYHIQTEYYKSSGKIVTNIFKDGRAVKRLERGVPELSEEEINSEVEKFHRAVVERLRGARGSVSAKPAVFSLPDELRRRILEEISPFFGVASSLVLEEGIASSKSFEELVRFLTSDLEGEERDLLSDRLLTLASQFSAVSSSFSLSEDEEQKILEVLAEYVGIMATVVLEEVLEKLKGRGGGYEELVSELASQCGEDEKVMREKLKFLRS